VYSRNTSSRSRLPAAGDRPGPGALTGMPATSTSVFSAANPKAQHITPGHAADLDCQPADTYPATYMTGPRLAGALCSAGAHQEVVKCHRPAMIVDLRTGTEHIQQYRAQRQRRQVSHATTKVTACFRRRPVRVLRVSSR